MAVEIWRTGPETRITAQGSAGASHYGNQAGEVLYEESTVGLFHRSWQKIERLEVNAISAMESATLAACSAAFPL